MKVRFYVTGSLAVEVDGEVVIDERRFRGKQERLVFAYLVTERTRPVTRDELAEAVWPGEMAPSWEASLSALVSRLRTHLSSDPLRDCGVSLSHGLGQYQLQLPADAWVDLETGASAIDMAEGNLRAGDLRHVLGSAAVATAIARRPFLPGIEGEWVEAQRRKLERQLLRGLECLAEMWLTTGEPRLAVESALEAIALDPFQESGYRLLMQAYAASANRAEAIKVYHRLRKLLGDDLGTGPSVETEILYTQLLA